MQSFKTPTTNCCQMTLETRERGWVGVGGVGGGRLLQNLKIQFLSWICHLTVVVRS